MTFYSQFENQNTFLLLYFLNENAFETMSYVGTASVYASSKVKKKRL